jgi:hypothetical protein
MRSRLGATSGQVKPLRQIERHLFPVAGNTAAVGPMRRRAPALGARRASHLPAP